MEICICGNSIVQPTTGRKRSYCSDLCRLHAFRKGEVKRNETRATEREDIRLYCGVCSVSYNRHPTAPGPYACVSPVSGRDDHQNVTEASRRNVVSIPPDTLIIQDSGAFSDGPGHRLSHADALQRQVAHAKYYKYSHQVTHRASYDLLIDEIWREHFRRKERWSEQAGEYAVKATVEAARFLDQHRAPNIGCIMSAQGVTPAQYVDCVGQVLPYVDPQRDLFGLGGWCILGMQHALLSVFRETIAQVIPLLASNKVQRVHIWGVCFAEPLGELLYLCDQHKIKLSTDSIHPALLPEHGDWGYASWRDSSYKKPPVLDSCKTKNASGYNAPSCASETRCMGLERARHVEATRNWLAHFKDREPSLYHAPKSSAYRQLSWMEAVS